MIFRNLGFHIGSIELSEERHSIEFSTEEIDHLVEMIGQLPFPKGVEFHEKANLFNKLRRIQENINKNKSEKIRLPIIKPDDTIRFYDKDGKHWLAVVLRVTQSSNPDFPNLDLVVAGPHPYRICDIPHISKVQPQILCWERRDE